MKGKFPEIIQNEIKSIAVIPGFDVLKWKQENQARIRRETEGMTDGQIRERRRQAVEEDIRWKAEYAKSAESVGK